MRNISFNKYYLVWGKTTSIDGTRVVCNSSSIYLLQIFLLFKSAPGMNWFQVSGLSKRVVQHQPCFLSGCCPWLKGHMNIEGEEAMTLCTRAEAQMNICIHLCTHTMRHTNQECKDKERFSLPTRLFFKRNLEFMILHHTLLWHRKLNWKPSYWRFVGNCAA